MQILLGPPPLLEEWESRPLHPDVQGGPLPGAFLDRYEAVMGHEPPGPPEVDGPFRRAAHAIMGYEIFPPPVGGRVLRRPVRVGDTVGLLYRFLPWLTLFFASRVTEVFDGAGGRGWRAGFTYRTLPGHPELGEETFAVEKDAVTGEVRFSLDNWSRPGGVLTWLFLPLARRLQRRASLAALQAMAARCAGEPQPTRRTEAP